ncbi:transposase [Streptomyces sp. NPDC059378]|uniref:transposase n=1 Tax=Streptomyces sp. NPDC059378 TaxID=3346815 RepID=UPI003694CEBB
MSLTDAEWARTEPLLPDRTPWRGGRWRDHRQVIDAIAFKYRTGTPWMDLPEHFGSWKGGHNRLRKWAADDTWERVFTALLAHAEAEGDLDWVVAVDSTIVRAPAQLSGHIRPRRLPPDRRDRRPCGAVRDTAEVSDQRRGGRRPVRYRLGSNHSVCRAGAMPSSLICCSPLVTCRHSTLRRQPVRVRQTRSTPPHPPWALTSPRHRLRRYPQVAPVRVPTRAQSMLFGPGAGEDYADKKSQVRRQRFYGNIGHYSGLRGSWPTTQRSETGSATLRE